MQFESRWTTDLNDYVFNVPALADDAVLAGCDDGYAYLFDRDDGTIRRRFELADWVRGDSGPVVVGDEAYVATHEPGGPGSDERGRVYRLNLETGTTDPVLDETREYSAMPGIDATADLVCVTVGEVLTAYDPPSFDERWTLDNRSPGEERSYLTPPVIDGETVYVGVKEIPGSLYALDSDSVGDPDIRWEADLGGEPTRPAAAGDLVTVATRDGTVLGFDTADGTGRWQAEIGVEPDAPRIADGRVYVVAEGTVYALDSDDGSTIWTFDAEGGLTGPVGANDTVVCASAFSGGSSEPTDAVYAVDAATGRQTARVETGEAYLSPPLVDGTDIYVGGGYGFLAYEVVDPPRPIRERGTAPTAAQTESDAESAGEDDASATGADEGSGEAAGTTGGAAAGMVERTVEIRGDQAEWLDDAYFDLSAFVRDKLDERME